MLHTSILTIRSADGEREILVSPFKLHLRERRNLKSGKIEVLHFYDQMQDEAYKKMIEKETLPEELKSDRYILNLGQDFRKHYLGSLEIDFDNKHCGRWEGKPEKISKEDVRILIEMLFDPELKSRSVILFTPTRPSDINLIKKRSQEDSETAI